MPEVPSFLTVDEAARRLGVSRERVGFWVQSGKMPVAARSNVGFLLSTDKVDRLGPELAANAPAFPWSKGRGVARRKLVRVFEPAPDPLPCGCVLGRSFCRHGAILSAAVALAESFAAECPTATYKSLAGMARQALAEHLATSGDDDGNPAPCSDTGSGDIAQLTVSSADTAPVAEGIAA